MRLAADGFRWSMTEKMAVLVLALGLVLAAFVPSSEAVGWEVVTPLDEYVHRDDGFFSWTEVASYNFDGVTMYIINMTSQKYQDETFSSQPIWWHEMGVAIPDEIQYLDAAILFIDGGSNRPGDPPSEQTDTAVVLLSGLANDTKCISAYIKQIPNQPIVFANDPTQRSRSEDSIIAWTWRTYIDDPTPDPEIILRMPMTKGAKRGLDTITQVAKQRVPESDIQRFMVSGASKRGWTTWSLAATDQRVKVMAPMVFSMINMDQTVMSHFQSMDGAWSFALDSYYRENLTQEFFNPKADGVWSVEDMYNYRERFTLPFLEMVSSGDEFFLTDDNWNWWDAMPDPKYLLMLPNAEHSMAPHYLKIYETAVSFWLSYLEGIPYPTVTWQMSQTDTTGSIILHSNPPPVELTAFSAVTLGNDTRRDFRLASVHEDGEVGFHPVLWTENLAIIDLGGGSYQVNADVVEGEWVGFFFMGTWEGPTGYRMMFTSQVNIIPDIRPSPPCTSPETCWSVLV